MASEVTKNEQTGDVESVKLDKVLVQGDEGWGLHNPVPRETDALSVHDSDEDPGEAVQVDIPQSEGVASDELYAELPEPAKAEEPAPAKSSSKSDSADKS